MIESLEMRRDQIIDFTEKYVSEIEEVPENQWNENVEKRLLDMVKRGKMVRGALIIETFEAFSNENKEILKAAAAIELAHTALLVDDDIIDEDDRRRGIRSVHKQYQEDAEERGFDKVQHYGISKAICLSNIAYFLSFKLMSEIEIEKGKSEAMQIFWKELTAVGMAEMQDIHAGFSTEEMGEEEILDLYREKTANYTFTLPMKLGANLANRKELDKRLKQIGENIGIVYQLKDDELGLPGEKGKLSGSDLDENKKTLHRLYLLEKLPDKEEQDVRKILQKDLKEEQKMMIRNKMEDKNVLTEVRQKMQEHEKAAREEINQSNLPEQYKKQLVELTKFCREREK